MGGYGPLPVIVAPCGIFEPGYFHSSSEPNSVMRLSAFSAAGAPSPRIAAGIRNRKQTIATNVKNRIETSAYEGATAGLPSSVCLYVFVVRHQTMPQLIPGANPVRYIDSRTSLQVPSHFDQAHQMKSQNSGSNPS